MLCTDLFAVEQQAVHACDRVVCVARVCELYEADATRLPAGQQLLEAQALWDSRGSVEPAHPV